MTHHSGEAHGEDMFAPIAFGLLATGLGVVVVRKLLEKGRERHAAGEPGVVYSDEEAQRTIVVRNDAVHFQEGPYGPLALSHDKADTVLADLAPHEHPQTRTPED